VNAVFAPERRRPDRISPAGLGLDSDATRWTMAEALEARGIKDPGVLDAMAHVPRHLFVDPALASRAYEDVALPIGLEQTISKPSIVARMLELAASPIPLTERRAARVLEIGSGCGYQAAVLAQVFGQVVSVERLRALHHKAARNLRGAGVSNVRLIHSDGHLGLKNSPPVSRNCAGGSTRRRYPGRITASDSCRRAAGCACQQAQQSATMSG